MVEVETDTRELRVVMESSTSEANSYPSRQPKRNYIGETVETTVTKGKKIVTPKRMTTATTTLTTTTMTILTIYLMKMPVRIKIKPKVWPEPVQSSTRAKLLTRENRRKVIHLCDFQRLSWTTISQPATWKTEEPPNMTVITAARLVTTNLTLFYLRPWRRDEVLM